MATSEVSARVGVGDVIVDFSIRLATATAFSGEATGADHPLLGARHILRRHFDAEVAARYHEAIGKLDDFL